jgi:RHS repeat-associated protein
LHDETLDMDSYHYRNLWHGPQRWGSVDPAGFRGDENPYGFVGNNPISTVDPLGLLGVSDFNPALLFNGQAWGQLLHDKFIGDNTDPAQDPNSIGALSANAGYGFKPLYDADGNALGNPASAVGGAVVGGIVDAASLLAGGGEAKAVKCEIKASENMANALRKHHSWPKYLGGAEKQDLVPLEKWLHDEYHRGLDKILPRRLGTDYYDSLTGVDQQQVLKDLADYTKGFDAAHGTKLYNAMIKEGFPLP